MNKSLSIHTTLCL